MFVHERFLPFAGTCINNTGVFMFKKGCFELGATIHPVVIKVNTLCTHMSVHAEFCVCVCQGATVGGAYLPGPYQLLISSAEASAFSLAVETQKVAKDCYANTT